MKRKLIFTIMSIDGLLVFIMWNVGLESVTLTSPDGGNKIEKKE